MPDAGSEDGTMIEVAEKSILWLRLTLLGQQGHASRPQRAENTLRAAAHVIVALDELHREFPGQNPLFRPPESTFEPTRKEANVGNINTIPGRDVFYLDCRVLPEIRPGAGEGAGPGHRHRGGPKFGVTLEVEPVQDSDRPRRPRFRMRRWFWPCSGPSGRFTAARPNPRASAAAPWRPFSGSRACRRRCG